MNGECTGRDGNPLLLPRAVLDLTRPNSSTGQWASSALFRRTFQTRDPDSYSETPISPLPPLHMPPPPGGFAT